MESTFLKKLIIEDVHEEIEGFKTLCFREGHGISYKAGQFLTFSHMANQMEIRRSYSICSSPAWNEPLAIGVRRIENGFYSRLLVDNAKPGDILWTTGAGGFFTLPEEIRSVRSLYLFAAGSGITPLFSLLKTVIKEFPDCRVFLIYSSHQKEQCIFYERLKELASTFSSQLFIEFLFSNNPDLLKARLHRDLLLGLLERYGAFKEPHSLYYICGPLSYMRMIHFTLRESGISGEQIREEEFVIQKPAKLVHLPIDKVTREVTIHFQNSSFRFEVSYPDTILSAARKQGVILPYSCEAGRCGNCVAKCLKGSVWLSNNEVLTEKELLQGLTLTCVGHPVNGNVTLQI